MHHELVAGNSEEKSMGENEATDRILEGIRNSEVKIKELWEHVQALEALNESRVKELTVIEERISELIKTQLSILESELNSVSKKRLVHRTKVKYRQSDYSALLTGAGAALLAASAGSWVASIENILVPTSILFAVATIGGGAVALILGAKRSNKKEVSSND